MWLCTFTKSSEKISVNKKQMNLNFVEVYIEVGEDHQIGNISLKQRMR
jgi:hypothetical protein